jgi:hypothetical protein
MTFEPETTKIEFTKLLAPPKRLELLRDTEAFLRRPTVSMLVSVLPPKLGRNLQTASFLADDALNQLAEVDLEKISDFELQPARVQVGLCFVGFSALMIIVLLLYLKTLHPELSAIAQIGKHWYQYVWFVSLGVAGMFILGREAMRRP